MHFAFDRLINAKSLPAEITKFRRADDLELIKEFSLLKISTQTDCFVNPSGKPESVCVDILKGLLRLRLSDPGRDAIK
jgi:hypothetical protein